MKKIILIVAVLVVALVGLTSYNGKEVKKESGDDSLIAAVKTSTTGTPVVGNKKLD